MAILISALISDPVGDINRAISPTRVRMRADIKIASDNL